VIGASYGGYAALMGPIRYPDLYRCSIAWVAVTDPRFLYEDSWSSDLTDEDRLFDRPAIKIPVLHAFAGGDRRVPFKHGTEMRDALHAAGNDPEWIVYPDEGHGWLQVDTNLDFWTHVEAFLAKNDR
jgi:dipeptidyl aminopeptidase/acylaminoacyl peptidase